MEYLARLLGLSEIEKAREKQIIRQRQLDKRVEQQLDKCPQTIAAYYLHHRELSRQQQTKFINTSFIDKMPTLKRELNQNDIYYDGLEKALDSSCFCQQLEGLIEEDKPGAL